MNIKRSYREYKADQDLTMTLARIFRILEWPRVTPGERMSRRGKLPGRVVLDAIDIGLMAQPYRRKDETGLITTHYLAELLAARRPFQEFKESIRQHHHVDVEYDRVNTCFYLVALPSYRAHRL